MTTPRRETEGDARPGPKRRSWRRRLIAAAPVLLLVGSVTAATSNWSYIDAYFSTNVGAPDQTFAALPIDAKATAVTRLAVAGDVGTGGPEEYATAAAIDTRDEQAQYQALLLLGDNVYDNGDPALIDDRVHQPFADVLDRDTDLLAVLGNHDVQDGNGPGQLAALGLPARWYTTTIDDTLIIALDSNEPGNLDQLAWLDEQLRAERPTWTIVIMHHPAYSAGWHGSSAGVQDHLVPLFERYGVDLVLSGHDHDYQRSHQINGITYVVTGAAAKLRDTGRAEFTEVSWSTHSFVDLTITADAIVGQAINHQGRSIDTFEIGPRLG